MLRQVERELIIAVNGTINGRAAIRHQPGPSMNREQRTEKREVESSAFPHQPSTAHSLRIERLQSARAGRRRTRPENVSCFCPVASPPPRTSYDLTTHSLAVRPSRPPWPPSGSTQTLTLPSRRTRWIPRT